MKRLAAFVITMTAWSAGQAMAGAFDGNWIGQIAPSGGCPGATMTITVSGSALSGAVHNPGNVSPFKGTIDADGNATFTTRAGHPGTIKFITDHFDANWKSGCRRHSLGDRAPGVAQSTALIAQRNEAQAAYDDLIARAARGDRSVDFTLLRSSYPFTRQWDAYGTAIGPLMEQAHVAAQGKDCVTALEKLDEVLKVDFTVIAAHRVRSDCLKGETSRVESRIADGLMRSLTHGGNGKSENSAYPVMTLHEETDLLADRHIVLRTRDVEIRGSNGRFYDVVHGISLRDGIRVQDVYFDVTAEVNGRSSAMAAADSVAVALPR